MGRAGSLKIGIVDPGAWGAGCTLVLNEFLCANAAPLCEVEKACAERVSEEQISSLAVGLRNLALSVVIAKSYDGRRGGDGWSDAHDRFPRLQDESHQDR